MMNYRKLLRITAILVLTAITAIGCRKEESIVSSFVINGSKNYYFEYDQTIKVEFSSKRIATVEVISKPEGWDYSVQTGYIAIHAPASGGETSGTFEIKATSTAGAAYTKKVEVAIVYATDLSTAGKANCYISPTSGRYSFDGTSVEGMNGTLTPSGAKLVWCAPADIVSSVQLLNGNISFSTSGEGNALIAATDSKGQIIWSWHIWASDYDPAATAQTSSDGNILMSRNLGAWAESNDTEKSAWGSCGTYYQWGRKDPFVGGKAYMQTVDQSMYNASGAWVGVSARATSQSVGTISYATQNPTTIIYGTEKSGYDWLAKHDNTLWSATTKTAYDPCPAGWRVATASAIDFDSSQLVGEYLRGWEIALNESENALFIAAGRRSFVDGDLTNVDVTGYLPVGFYWSAESNGDKATALEFSPTAIGQSAIYRANACPVRCIKM